MKRLAGAPAFDTSARELGEAAVGGAPWMIGCSMPNSSVIRVLIGADVS
jgi:hypothetical protein